MAYANLDDKKAHDAQYYVKNRLKILAQNKSYTLAHKEEKAAYHKAYREQHREKARAYMESYRLKNPDAWTNGHLRRRYNLDAGEYQVLFEAQGGRCKICGRTEEGRSLSVDHCHMTGKIRGLLCVKCNTGLAMFGDTVATFRAAIHYLERG